MKRVFIDANVIVPYYQTDLLLRAAELGLLTPLWSQMVLDETKDALQDNYPPMIAQRATRRVDIMAAAFSEAMVTGFEQAIDAVKCPDPKDKHVIAAASHAYADLILTSNLRHVGHTVLAPYGLEAQTPDLFLNGLATAYPDDIITILTEMSADSVNPPMTVGALLQRLSATEATTFVATAQTLLAATDTA